MFTYYLNIYIMKLEILSRIKDDKDILVWMDFNPWFMVNNRIDQLFAYLWDVLVWHINYGPNPHIKNSVVLYEIYIDHRLNFKKWIFWNKSYDIWSKLIYDLLNIEVWKNIMLYSTDSARWFYSKLWFERKSLAWWFQSWNNLSQIKKNLELRLKSPWYVKLAKEDLVRLWIISKNLETVV